MSNCVVVLMAMLVFRAAYGKGIGDALPGDAMPNLLLTLTAAGVIDGVRLWRYFKSPTP